MKDWPRGAWVARAAYIKHGYEGGPNRLIMFSEIRMMNNIITIIKATHMYIYADTPTQPSNQPCTWKIEYL